MEQNLEINNKFVSFNGVIGRRDYLINIIFICLIGSIFSVPYTIWIMANVVTIGDMFNIGKIFLDAPMLLKIWVLLGTSLTLFLSLSNMFRRLNDICGRVSNTVNISCAIFIILSAFGYILVPALAYLGSLIAMIIGLILIFTPGKITGKLPYDVTKVFNWGAFLGTWIWGLINKCYIPLWYLLLWWTPFGFYFQIWCGLKGNEWAYKNNKCTDVDEFNKSQRKQTTIWAIITAVLIPLLYILFIFAIVFIMAGAIALDAKTNGPEKTMSRFENFIETQQSLYFESHEITENENKYYILPSDWAMYSFSTKKDIFDLAASSASIERTKKYPQQGTYHSKTDELVRTKIYSSKNGELLGEFVMDESFMKAGSTKEAFMQGIKAAMKAYRFYKPTEK